MFFLLFYLFAKSVSPKKIIPKAPLCQAIKQKLVLDVDTNEVIQSCNAQDLMAPSSMTKILTVLYTLELIKQGKVSLDEVVTVPKEAYQLEGTTMFLEVGQRLTVRELLDGIAVVSGNDACCTLAIHICGDEATFARDMTAFAKKIGAKHTNFVNTSGLPDPQHLTTPYDLAIISLYLLSNHKGQLDRFAQQEFTYNNIHQYNKNVILGRSSPLFVCDGLKTGYTEKAGCGIVATAYHPKTHRHILCVLNGCHSQAERKKECLETLEWAFKNTQQKIIHKVGESIAKLPVRFGDIDVVDIVPKKNVGYVRISGRVILGKVQSTADRGPIHSHNTGSFHSNSKDCSTNTVNGSSVSGALHLAEDDENAEIKVTIQLPKFLKGPLPAGAKVGQIVLCINNKSKKIPLVTAVAIKPAHFLKGLWHRARYFG